MSRESKRIDIAEFRRLGFLQEANRLFFHPLGLALEVKLAADGTETLGGVWDYRDDPEGIVFGDGPDVEKFANVEAERLRHAEARRQLLGLEIQGVGQPCHEDADSVSTMDRGDAP